MFRICFGHNGAKYRYRRNYVLNYLGSTVPPWHVSRIHKAVLLTSTARAVFYKRPKVAEMPRYLKYYHKIGPVSLCYTRLEKSMLFPLYFCYGNSVHRCLHKGIHNRGACPPIVEGGRRLPSFMEASMHTISIAKV